MSDTNAVKWLRGQEVAFRVLEYKFTEVGADLAADAVGRPLESCCKTLVVKAAGRQFWVAIVPGDQRFDEAPPEPSPATVRRDDDRARKGVATVKLVGAEADVFIVGGEREGVDIRRLDPCPRDRRADRGRAQHMGRNPAQGAAEAADRRARGRYDDDVVHILLLPAGFAPR